MSLARAASVFLAAATAVTVTVGNSIAAQEASAEITATATVTPPPVGKTGHPLNFGTLLPGETVDIESSDFRGWGAEDHEPGRLEIEDFYGGGSFTITLASGLAREAGDGFQLTNGEATLDVIWDSPGHGGVYIERTSGRTGAGTDPSGYYPWQPQIGESDAFFATPSTGQAGATNITLNATVYIGGRVAWTGGEPPGEYTGSITVTIDFSGQ